MANRNAGQRVACRAGLALGAWLCVAVAPSVPADVTWYRMYAYSDGGGTWNTVPGSGNWYVWVTPDPISNPAPTFLSGADPTISIPLAAGVTPFTLYRDNYANQDAGSTFYLSIDGTPATLSVVQNPAPWGSPATFDPLLIPALPSVTVGTTTVRITDYRWLAGDVLARDLVGSTGFAPDARLDHIGEVTFEVIVPEPAAGGLVLLASVPCLVGRRRHPSA